MKPKTVTVNIAAAVDEQGNWYAIGLGNDPSKRVNHDKVAMDIVEASVNPNHSKYFITAVLEVPGSPKTVKATDVEKA